MDRPLTHRIKALLLWVGLLASDTTAQLLIKVGSVDSHASRRLSFGIVSGYSLLVVSFALWMQILRLSRLSIALSVTSLLYIIIPLASHFVLGEPMTFPLIIGASFIGVGVFILGYRENSEEKRQ